MDGAHPLLVCAVEWRWCVLLSVCPVRVAQPRVSSIPARYSSVLLSCRVLSRCRVCGVWVVSICLWCLCGGVSSDHSPLTVVVGGGIVDGGVALCGGGGMTMEGRLL